MKRLVAIGNFYGAHEPYAYLFKNVVVFPAIRGSIEQASDFNLTKDDVLLFGGGEDISPTLYKQRASRFTGASNELSKRDVLEKLFFDKAVALNIPMIGICRGAQLLCALSGGSLYQHVNKHGNGHEVDTNTGQTVYVSSVHHQMMNPLGTKHELIAWSKEILSNVHLVEGEQNLDVTVEPEVVYFQDTKALAIQYHPEFMSEQDEGYKYAQDLVNKYILQGA